MVALTISKVETCDNVKIITCRMDGHSYLDFPNTLHYLGDRFTKTGWNNDRHEVYYKFGAELCT